MKTLKEKIAIMQAYEDGKELEVASIGRTFKDISVTPTWNWQVFDYRIKDEYRDIKRAYSEGARIEVLTYNSLADWNYISSPSWESSADKYRIKDGISIEQWDKFKEVIKAYWRGAEIECRNKVFWHTVQELYWNTDIDYRVKPEATVMTLSDIEKKLGVQNLKIVK